MATITGFTAARMLGIENNSVVGGTVIAGDLILTRQSGATINAGSVIGPTGSPGVTVGQLATAFPAGMIVDYIGTTAPNADWLLMNGQTIVNGQTLYANLWAVLPASMKSGSSIVFPDTRGKVAVALNASDVDFDTIGETGGSKTHTLTTAQIPSHAHTGPSHSHTGPSHSHSGPSHQHNIDHGHSGSSAGSGGHAHSVSGTTNVDGPHDHFYDNIVGTGHMAHLIRQEGVGPNAIPVVAGPDLLSWGGQPGSVGETHAHNFSGSSNNPGDHTHGITVDNLFGSAGFAGTGSTGNAGTGSTGLDGTGSTGTAGSDGSHNNVQPYIVLQKIIKAV